MDETKTTHKHVEPQRNFKLNGANSHSDQQRDTMLLLAGFCSLLQEHQGKKERVWAPWGSNPCNIQVNGS